MFGRQRATAAITDPELSVGGVSAESCLLNLRGMNCQTQGPSQRCQFSKVSGKVLSGGSTGGHGNSAVDPYIRSPFLRRPSLRRTAFIGITGSARKTTTKDLVASILERHLLRGQKGFWTLNGLSDVETSQWSRCKQAKCLGVRK